MTKSQNSEKDKILEILFLTYYIYQLIIIFCMEYLQNESHEYTLYEQITLCCLTCLYFVILVQKMWVSGESYYLPFKMAAMDPNQIALYQNPVHTLFVPLN